MRRRTAAADCRAFTGSEIEEVLWDEAAIRARVEQLGERIARDYRAKLGEALADSPPVAVGLLCGAFVFMADLIRQMAIPVECHFMHVTSYGRSSDPGELRVVKDLEIPVKGRHILIVEDIVDTGGTFAYLKEHLGKREPASLRFCALVDKTPRRQAEVTLDYTGFRLDRDAFLVGYGLDYAERFRNLPYIAALKSESQ